MAGLNERQRRFCEIYAADPNAAEAAKAAGYSERTARAQGARLLTNVDIQQYIRHLQDDLAAGRIATMTQTKAFWSDVMNAPAERTADRLKASELLARSAGEFLHFKPEADSIILAGENDGNDVVIYMPQMLTEEECRVVEDEQQSIDTLD